MSLLSYRDVATFCTTARDISKGKPLRNWGRFTEKENTYLLSVYNLPFVIFHPNNTLEFVITKTHSRRIGPTLATTCSKHLPFMWYRKSMGLYEIKLLSNMPKPSELYWHTWDRIKATPPIEVFSGLIIDLTTGIALNPKASDTSTIVPQKRIEWLRALRKFKQAAKLRAKIGVFDVINKEVILERKSNNWEAPDWDTDIWQDKLYQNISNGTIDTDLIKAFVQSNNRWSIGAVKSIAVLNTIDNICKQYSRDLRRRFGVFSD